MNSVCGKPRAAECEPDPYLRDSEQVLLLKVSYEISFTRYFCKPKSIASGSRAWGSGQLIGGGRLT
jgi:hypothetical protein